MQFYKNSRNNLDNSEESEEWIFSYADLMTLLLGFFIIMYSFSTFDDKKFNDLTSELNQAFKGKKQKKEIDSDVLNKNQKQLKTLNQMVALLNMSNIQELQSEVQFATSNKILRKKLEKALGKSVDSQTVFTELILPGISTFDPSSYRLKKSAIENLRTLAQKISKIEGAFKIEISGHSDSQPLKATHPLKNNYVLSAARAGAVAEVFVRNGIKKDLISIRGMGDLDPLAPNKTPDGRWIPENMKKNRRVHIKISKLK